MISISKSLLQFLPVTKMRFPAASYAMPFSTSVVGVTSSSGNSPVKVYDPFDHACRRVDDDDLVGRVDVGPQLAVDPLQLVEEIDRHAFERHRRAFLAFERRRVERVDIGRAVRHVELLPVGGQSPAFAGVAELLDFLACFQVVDIGFVRLPRELVQLAVEQRDPFAEILLRQPCEHLRAPGFEVEGLHDRLAVLPGAFPQHAVGELQPLRITGRRVRIYRADAVRVFFRRDRSLGAFGTGLISAARREQQAE